MAFTIKNIAEPNFQHLNHFFLTGFDSPKLIEQVQKLQLDFAEVHFSEWYFDGIRMGYSDWRCREPTELEWQYDIKAELITFQANLHGSVFINNQQQTQQIFGNQQHNLFYANTDDVNEGILKCDDLRLSMFFIQFTKAAFLRLTQGANESLNRFNDSVLHGHPSLLSPTNLPLNAAMLNLIHNIVNCAYTEGLKKMYLLSKSIEFLVLQAEACTLAQQPAYQHLKTKYDEECIHYAREYLLNHVENPPSLSELAKIIGLNEYKLKRGFKEVFGNTVFGYLAEARLEIAKNEILDSKKNISQIAAELGYSSVQHFSHAFRKKFGFSPNKLKT
ncbi:helix-turn-helix transcriptional regulator [Haliscomenobacter hydrossis]|uniref:Transcriptional regulator, AraC family n=1 Tax=Haliscomenobacter hydrossis (strain ATCC 27775 / DSM 1100 / LMG 10767 / O) TaxID=760192 RepID=F4L2Q1_HALH1|nr:AraC family transcriptional regulator [Haliscomenobacter hydrossis]AEE48615.1 transcriptional regulator, AraC family [Haliscomenobacter hydrossis DSM 1100]